MEIVNKTPEQGSLSENLFDLGNIQKRSSKTFIVKIKTDKKHQRLIFGCGSCTKGSATQEEDGVQLQITYTAIDSKGQITKTVKVLFTDGTTQIIKFTAKVV